MPMNVTISLLASQRQNIDTLSVHRPPDCLRNPINLPLKGKVFILGEITRYMFLMLDGSNQRVTVQSGVFIQENNGRIILMDDMVSIETSSDHLTNEARIILYPLDVIIQVKAFVFVIVHSNCPLNLRPGLDYFPWSLVFKFPKILHETHGQILVATVILLFIAP